MSRISFAVFISLICLPRILLGEVYESDCTVQAIEDFDDASRVREILPSIRAVRICSSSSSPARYLGLGPIQSSGNGYKYFQIRDLSQSPGQNTSTSFVLSFERKIGDRYDGRWVVIDSEALDEEELSVRLGEAAILSQCVANHFCFRSVFAKLGLWDRLFGGNLADRVAGLDAALENTARTVLTMHYPNSTNVIVLMKVGVRTVRISINTTNGWTLEGLSFVDM